LSTSVALPIGIALACAFGGMYLGQSVRSRLEPQAFRRWFLIAMILLGIYLVLSTIYSIARA
jgi:uncharacterized membrane protein YfcA